MMFLKTGILHRCIIYYSIGHSMGKIVDSLATGSHTTNQRLGDGPGGSYPAPVHGIPICGSVPLADFLESFGTTRKFRQGQTIFVEGGQTSDI